MHVSQGASVSQSIVLDFNDETTWTSLRRAGEAPARETAPSAADSRSLDTAPLWGSWGASEGAAGRGHVLASDLGFPPLPRPSHSPVLGLRNCVR